MRKGLLALGLALLLAAPATGASSPARYKLRPGVTLKQALASMKRIAGRAPGFSGIECWMWDGNARRGWRHGSCTGNYNYAGTTYRFKGTWTPISCAKLRYTIVIPGVPTQRGTTVWKHQTFVCG